MDDDIRIESNNDVETHHIFDPYNELNVSQILLSTRSTSTSTYIKIKILLDSVVRCTLYCEF